MNRNCTALASLALTLVSLAALIVCNAPLARAAPPTVTPSPGYDARLQEQRKAATSVVIDPAPAVPPAPGAPRHHAKGKKQGH